jgi:curli biogenesis system outer membrane secretion channel CsgG
MRIGYAILAAAVLSACGTSTKETYSRDEMKEIGNYPPKPSGFLKSRAAIVDFQDKTDASGGRGAMRVSMNEPGVIEFKDATKSPLGKQASDQFITLVVRSDRFSLIERTRLNDMLKEQGMTGVVDPAELAKPGKVRGIDYLFFGAITNFRVKAQKVVTGGGIFDSILGNIAPVDIDTSRTEVEIQVGVDIRLVNTTTGEIVASEFGEVKRVDSASAWGLRILGIGGDAKNDVTIDEDSKGKVLRWALDESYRKMIPPIDAKFARAQVSYCPNCKVELEADKKFCTKCGKNIEPPKCAKCQKPLEPGAKFCGSCGAKAEEAPKPQ